MTAKIDVLLLAATGDDALERAFGRADRFELTVVDSVEAALDHVDGEAPPPQLLLIEFEGDRDGEGARLLRTVKSDDRFQRLPAITISRTADACTESYDQHANAHVERPSDDDGFDELVERIESFWVRAATLPPVTNDT